jgi:putative SOS response-associated peptidase YedK
LSLLAPVDENLLDYREVSRSVNNSRNEGPELIEPS